MTVLSSDRVPGGQRDILVGRLQQQFEAEEVSSIVSVSDR